MRKTLIATCFIVTMVTVGIWALVTWDNDPVKRRLRDGYRFVSASEAPLIRRLYNDEIEYETPINMVISEFPPVWTRSYGKYVVYEFAEPGLTVNNLVAHDGVVVSAYASSCTWEWTFFDRVPSQDATTMSRIRALREHVARFPETRADLEPYIDEMLVSLN